ncbi:L-histidine N(alpha)-methyltransferase [Streptomyces sp. 8L]|uniref:L-histidine N(alpha)-methyltransferase n=1 Tax=Streptomyces sp. 8L TaxID=2877242 RepID=UPI001CD5BD7A|nr:L-histidine N(alpha)-methyltransferase [Streptomyces sp. 8L]MCA1217362.1 L-histidine N(alpha)-methyltransferase [Streptomyces sp. 8L]
MSTQTATIDLDLLSDVRKGLCSTPKTLSPKWLYDAVGSYLFEAITHLPEYYPTRAEATILAEHSTTIARFTQADTLIELGSGFSEKTRLLLDTMGSIGNLQRYCPVDISTSALDAAASSLAPSYQGLTIEPVVADFTTFRLPKGTRLVAFLGGTFGNLLPAERSRFLISLRGQMQPGDALLLGVDLVKDPDTLVRAYDDATGVTAAFNLNLLARLNRELGADFDLEAFEHRAVWDADHEWIEMRLHSRREQTVTTLAGGLTIGFATGEELRTEVSAKFRPTSLSRELAASGLTTQHWWTDPHEYYGLTLATPTASHRAG